MADDGGVLGNLPHSRPGQRSAKRSTPATAAQKAAEKAEAGGTPAAKAPRAKPRPAARKTRPAAPKPPPAAAPEPPPAPAAEPSGDAVGAAVRTVGDIAVTGVRVAGAVTRELLRRLPRP